MSTEGWGYEGEEDSGWRYEGEEDNGLDQKYGKETIFL